MSGDGPAFPVPDGDHAYHGECGLSKRDLIAAMAMQGLLASGITGPKKGVGSVAVRAVSEADALLAELARGRDDA